MDSKPPLVSIVIPAFNHARYLREAIESVLAQDYPHVELIVLNDGSTDHTQDVLDSFPPELFHRESHSNRGQSATLNRGWDMSRGEILAYLSADDVLRPQAVSRAVSCLAEQTDAVMVYCDFELMDQSSGVIRQVAAREFSYDDLLVKGYCQPGPGAFFRRDAWSQAGPWNGNLRQMPDYDYWLRLALVGRFQRIPATLAAFRVHPQSQTFAAAPFENCEEPMQIVTACLSREDLPAEVRELQANALSSACLTSAVLHWRAGRYHTALGRIARAWKLCPLNLLRPHAAHLMRRAVFGRLRTSGCCRNHACSEVVPAFCVPATKNVGNCKSRLSVSPSWTALPFTLATSLIDSTALYDRDRHGRKIVSLSPLGLTLHAPPLEQTPTPAEHNASCHRRPWD